MATGYAAFDGDDILVHTVSTHDRAAMVNWLVVNAGIMIPAGIFAIREHFDRHAKPAGVTVQRVSILPASGNGG